MTPQTLAEALTLIHNGAGGLTARLTGGFSNAPQSAPQERGAPLWVRVRASARVCGVMRLAIVRERRAEDGVSRPESRNRERRMASVAKQD